MIALSNDKEDANKYGVKTDTTNADLMKSFNDELEALMRTYDIDSFMFIGKKNEHTACLSRIGNPFDFIILEEQASDVFNEAINECKFPPPLKELLKDMIRHRKNR